MLKSIFCAILSIISIFTSVSSLVKTTKPITDGGVRVSYGDHYNEVMDVYIPENASGSMDVVLLIHGGAWMAGDQTEYDSYAETIADDYGYVAVTMNYKMLTNNATCNDMVNDVYKAVEKTDELLTEKGINADKMAVIGHSAGAQLTLLYSYSHYTDSPIDIGFVMCNSAPSDFFNGIDGSTTVEKFKYPLVSAMTHEAILPWNVDDYADEIASICPYTMVTSDVPPTIIVHGNKDEMVPYSNSVQLYNKLQDCGVNSVFITYPNSGHFLETDDEMDEVRADAFFEFASIYM